MREAEQIISINKLVCEEEEEDSLKKRLCELEVENEDLKIQRAQDHATYLSQEKKYIEKAINTTQQEFPF